MTTIFLMLQLLKRIETIYSVCVIYRDVKPKKFMLGAKTNNISTSSTMVSRSNGNNVSAGLTHELIGTSRFMSLNAHQGKEQSRRDDLEAIEYVFVYSLLGKLPWSGLKAPNFSEYNKMICDTKRSITKKLLNWHPAEFIYYLKYVRGLDFAAKPNYGKLRKMFKRLSMSTASKTIESTSRTVEGRRRLNNEGRDKVVRGTLNCTFHLNQPINILLC